MNNENQGILRRFGEFTRLHNLTGRSMRSSFLSNLDRLNRYHYLPWLGFHWLKSFTKRYMLRSIKANEAKRSIKANGAE